MADSKFLHIKGSRTQVYKTLPSNDVGNDGDIILSQIQGRGVYLCSKVNGRWHVSSKMEELRKIEKTSTKDFKTDKLRVLDDLSIGRGTTQITKDEAKFSSSLKIKEAANAISDTAAYGQLWVKTATPNELYFTTDAGDDIQITSGTATAFVGDITGVTAGDGLSGGGNSGAVSLAVSVDDSTIEINSDTLRVKDDGITYSKIQNVSATDRILGRDSSGAGVIEEITPANLRTMINVEDGATADQTKSDIDGLAITTVGTIDTGTWEGTTIAVDQGGTGATNSNAWLNSRITTNADGSLNYDATGATAVNHDSLAGFVSNEHIDWTASSAGTIHSTNYSNTMGSGFTVSATTDSNATTITQGDDLMFAAGTGITCETTADGTVTISSTVTDTNTTYSAGSLLDLSTTTFNVDLTELTDGTADVVGADDELVYLDDGSQKRKQIDEIKLGQFNNDQSWTSNAGTVTSVGTTGTVNGLTLTGTVTSSGNLTLGGTLAINNGDWSGTDLSVANGGTGASSLTDNSILTGTGTSAITAESNLTFDGTDLSIAATGKIYLDGGTHTYIAESSADTLSLYAGGDEIIQFKENGDDGNTAYFRTCSAGFTRQAATFSTSGVIGDGNDSTDVDFRHSNKYKLTLTNNISGSSEYINMIFPGVSGNFLLTLVQDGTGSRTVASAGWRAYASDETLCDNLTGTNGTDGQVRWAGGSAPTLTTTANKTDVISIYWDADDQTAFCVASLNF